MLFMRMGLSLQKQTKSKPVDKQLAGTFTDTGDIESGDITSGEMRQRQEHAT